MNKMNQAIIQDCLERTKELLYLHWDEIQKKREEDPANKIKIGMSYLINFKGDEQRVQTEISFGITKKDRRESIINPNQTTMPFVNAPESTDTGGDEPEDEEYFNQPQSSAMGDPDGVALEGAAQMQSQNSGDLTVGDPESEDGLHELTPEQLGDTAPDPATPKKRGRPKKVA